MTPRLAAHAAQLPSRPGSDIARFPSSSATAAWSRVTSGASGDTSPTRHRTGCPRPRIRVLCHRGADQRPGHDGWETTCGGFEPLDEGEDRPVLDLDDARAVSLLEHRVRRVRGEAVARVGGDDLFTIPPLKKRAPSELSDNMHRVNPASVPQFWRTTSRAAAVHRPCPEHDADRVARAHVAFDG